MEIIFYLTGGMEVEGYICMTCGVQYEPSEREPESCPICEDERQYVNPEGQKWTTLQSMKKEGRFQNKWVEEEEGLYSVKTDPGFAIGQTAYFIKQESGNVLWDCLTYLDEESIQKIKKLGGIHAIAISHPHYYSACIEWAEEFDAKVLLHENDRHWVQRGSNFIQYWKGQSFPIHKNMILHCLGGHFPGGTVMEWREGNEGKGILFSGDILQVAPDQDWVSFMYSYPNMIPLPAEKVKAMAMQTEEMKFDRIYSAFRRIVKKEAQASVKRSAKRYIAALDGSLFSGDRKS
ncbi:hypothetical protein LRR81_14755 [Metabacillus sp. GX 13764]|nr:hypothetical protein [Metabacillus kandeliae]